jgi:hypothetical protein
VDCVARFIKWLALLEPVLVEKINEIVPINLEAMIKNGDKQKFENRTHCYACEEQYPKEQLFMDHCHATGKIFFYFSTSFFSKTL